MSDKDEKEHTIKVSDAGYRAMMGLRDLLMAHGLDSLPPEYLPIVREELAKRRGDDAYPRGAVQSIAGRIALALICSHLGVGEVVEEPKAEKKVKR